MHQDTAALDRVIAKMLQCAENGEPWAIGMLGDRLDGKPGQEVIHSGGETPIRVEWEPSANLTEGLRVLPEDFGEVG